MTDNYMLNDEVMKFVSGGQLSEGWEKTILGMMAIFKGKYGDDGCEKITDVFYSGSESAWNHLDIEYGNGWLKTATIHYNY